MVSISLNIEKELLNNSRLLYTIDFLNNHPIFKSAATLSVNNPSAVLQLDYGIEQSGSFFIPTLNYFFFHSSNKYSHLSQGKVNTSSETLSVFVNDVSEPQEISNKKLLPCDILENIFFHISRYEEIFCKEKDKNQAGWLKEKIHFLVANSCHEFPLVDRLIFFWLENIGIKVAPAKSKYQLTHDIDILYKFRPGHKILRTIAGAVFHQRGIKYVFKNIQLFIASYFGSAKDPFDFFDELLDADEAWDQKVIYLMSGGNSEYDNKYNIEHPKVDEIIKMAISKNYFLGIHPSYNSSLEAKFLPQERGILQQKIKKQILHSRQHWLRFDWNKTPYFLTNEGISKDSSIGFNNHLGFRAGTGFEYHLYDFKAEKRFPWSEQPFAFMESSLIHYCRNNNQPLVEVAERFILRNKFGTCLCFNFHNSNFDTTTPDGKILTDFYINKFKSLLEH